jgi:WD40 repeat protein
VKSNARGSAPKPQTAPESAPAAEPGESETYSLAREAGPPDEWTEDEWTEDEFGERDDAAEFDAPAAPRPQRKKSPAGGKGRSGDKGTGRKKSQASATGGFLDNVPPKMLALGGGGVLLLLIVGLVIGLRGGGGGGGRGGDQAGNALETIPFDEDQFVVVDAPVDLAEFPLERQAAPVVQAPAAEAAPRADTGAGDGTPWKQVLSYGPQWEIAADAPAAPPEPLGEDLNVPIDALTLAGLKGPYVLGRAVQREAAEVAAATAAVRETKPTPRRAPRRPRSKAGEPPQPAPQPAQATTPVRYYVAPVVDLRTGEADGEFILPAYRTDGMRLSPDGKYLVTSSFLGATDRTAEGVLYVWQQKDPEPLAELQMPGHVAWMEFVSPTHLAMFAADPGAVERFAQGAADVRGVVQVSDVTTGEEVKTILVTLDEYLGPELPYNLQSGPQRAEYWLAPHTMSGAVSATGMYVALQGRNGLTLVSIAEGKEIGRLSVYYHERMIPRGWGLEFSPDGSQLHAVGSHVGPNNTLLPYLMAWDVTTGRPLLDCNVSNLPGGIPLPGPEEETIVAGTGVVDLFARQVVYTLPFTALRWSGTDRFLAWAPAEDNQSALVSRPFDRAAYAAAAAKPANGVARRPRVLAADRSGASAQQPQPPDKWTAPPGGTAVAPATSRRLMAEWPTAFSDRSAVLLTYDWIGEYVSNGRHELRARRIELETGQRVGQPIVLWPWSDPIGELWYQHSESRPAPPHVAALTADGARLSVRDPANPCRVDAWTEDGTRIGGMEPYGETPIDWVGWSGSGKLLTLGGGTLSAWDIATGKAAYDVAGDYTTLVDYGPERQWLAVAARDAVDLIDAESSRCLARCRRAGTGEPYEKLAVSPDGTGLAALRPGVTPPRAGATESTEWICDVWDLTNGRHAAVPVGRKPLQFLSWHSPRHVWVASKFNVEMIDTALGDVIWQGWFDGSNFHQWVEKGLPYGRATPDGQLWLYVPYWGYDRDVPPNVWHSQQAPPADSEIATLMRSLDAQQQVVDNIRVEVDLGERSRSEKFARHRAADLQRRGFTVAKGGWALRLSQTVGDSKEEVTFGLGAAVKIPKGVFTWQLVGPDGKAAWQQDQHLSWFADSSQYFQGASVEAVSHPDYLSVRSIKLDFKGRDPREAMFEEVLDRAIRYVQVPDNLPNRLLKSGGEHLKLPIVERIWPDHGKAEEKAGAGG